MYVYECAYNCMFVVDTCTYKSVYGSEVRER